MGTVLKMVRWLAIAALGISGLALMVAPALAQRELVASRSLDNSSRVGLPEAQRTTAASLSSQTSTNPGGSEARMSSEAATRGSTTTRGGRSSLPPSRAQEPGVGSGGELLGLALLILGLAVGLYSRPRPRIEYTTHQ